MNIWSYISIQTLFSPLSTLNFASESEVSLLTITLEPRNKASQGNTYCNTLLPESLIHEILKQRDRRRNTK